MLARLYAWLESRIGVFTPFDERQTPPAKLWRFAWHYISTVKGWLVVVFFSALVLAGVEASLLLIVGRLVDLLSGQTPGDFWANHGGWVLAIAGVLLVVRPLAHAVNEGVINQVVVPQLTNRIRWRTHVYTLGHSLSYFQGDFAGRIANRITQAGPAVRDVAVETLDIVVFVAVYAVVTLGAFTLISPWLGLPMLAWIVGYTLLMRWFVPEAQKRSLRVSEDRSALIGRIVDSYTNILTVKLFARADAERSAVRDTMTEHTVSYLSSMRLFTQAKAILVVLNTLLVVVSGGLALWLWSAG